jgi:hypothetical protein
VPIREVEKLEPLGPEGDPKTWPKRCADDVALYGIGPMMVLIPAIQLENAVNRILLNDSAVERMMQYLWPKVYIGTPDKARELVRGMLEAAKVLE